MKKTFTGLLDNIRMSIVQERVHTSAKIPNALRGIKRKEKKNITKQNTKKLCTVQYQSRSKWGIEGF